MGNEKNERFFTELAKAYINNDGAELQQEAAEIELEKMIPYNPALDRRIRSSAATHKLRRYGLRMLPFAAALLIFVFAYKDLWVNQPSANGPSSNGSVSADESPGIDPPTNDLRSRAEYISVSMPAGYAVTDIDYDRQTAILSIINEENNPIVLTVEANSTFDQALFTEIAIYGQTVYGLVRNDYSLLKYPKDDMLYTITSPYNYIDLIEVCENIIESL